jgi:hypothetical protein
VDLLDWKYRNSARVERQILAGARPGAIILSHDVHATTVAVVPNVFDSLLTKGYKFITVSELIAMDKPAPQARVVEAHLILSLNRVWSNFWRHWSADNNQRESGHPGR